MERMTDSGPIVTKVPPWTAEDEADLVLPARRTPALFKKLYLRWVSPVYRYLLYQVGDTSVAEDITSQVFLTAFEQLPRYQHRGTFAAWVFTIARNKARDHFRTSGRQVSMDAIADAAIRPDLLGEIIHADRLNHLDSLIRALPVGELEMIRLRYVAELSLAEIGALVHRSEEATRKAISRLLVRLQRQMEDDHE
jgi:RNA polymerase sigma-70 factor (ECF subfamily)